jgi:hypothetical protein
VNRSLKDSKNFDSLELKLFNLLIKKIIASRIFIFQVLGGANVVMLRSQLPTGLVQRIP